MEEENKKSALLKTPVESDYVEIEEVDEKELEEYDKCIACGTESKYTQDCLRGELTLCEDHDMQIQMMLAHGSKRKLKEKILAKMLNQTKNTWYQKK